MTPLLHRAIERWADQTPEQEAFRFGESALTYSRLSADSSRLARLLIAEGVEPSDRVGIYMLKGLELPVAIYGILKAGAAYVPIDPTSPPARLRSIVEDCDIRHLITNDSRLRNALDLAAELEQLECVVGPSTEDRAVGFRHVPWSEVEGADPTPPSIAVDAGDLAYVMYTSGSTGEPKGLMHTHRSGSAYVRMSAELYDVGPRDRLGNHSPLHFDMSTFEYLTAPNCGATTVIIPEETALFPVSLSRLIECEKLTFWYSVPLALIQLLDRGQIERYDASSLRWVLFGGEPFPPKYLRRLTRLWPQARFSNSYGPAEVNQCTYHHVPPAEAESDEPIPIGRLCPDVGARIVDAADREVESGEPGELLIAAPTLMRGYWGRPDLDRESFLELAGSEGTTTRFYRTGDLVRRRDDGLLLFLGRKDRRIKVRGYRVELDEVEGVLSALDEVAEAAAVALRDAQGETEIVAAVHPQLDGSCEPTALTKKAAERLPSYALPRRLEIVDRFPRTGSGKIDRKALAEELRAKNDP